MAHAVGIPKMQPATLLADLTKHTMGSLGESSSLHLKTCITLYKL